MVSYIFAILIFIFLWMHPVFAEMYRYRDTDGIVRYTDNLADVPEAQRPKTVHEKSPDSDRPTPSQHPSDRNETTDQPVDSLKSARINPTGDMPRIEDGSNGSAQIDTLLKSKMELDAEYAQIMKESLALSEQRKTVTDYENARAYNDKVATLNARIDDYEMRRAAFQKEADAFDASLKKQVAQPPQQFQTPSP
jgi:hypothetical protein